DAPCPTPAISLLVRQRGAAGGIMITASHNPYRWNGVKYKASYGSSGSPAITAQIEEELEAVLKSNATEMFPRNDLIHSLNVREPYLETLDKLVDWKRLRGTKFRFVPTRCTDPLRGYCTNFFCDMGLRVTKSVEIAIRFSAA